mgnify:FL=1
MEDFMVNWQKYFTENAAWFDKVPQDVLVSKEFHTEIAKKMDDVIAKMLGEEPTAKQVEAIDKLQKQLGTSYSYDCKAEAAYVEHLLKEKLK